MHSATIHHRILAAGAARAVAYLMPTGHTPTGAVMPVIRRQSLAALADAGRLTVVEDLALADLMLGDLTFGPVAPPPLSALSSRVIIEQAKGVLAQHSGLSMDAAFNRLRSYARHHNRRLSEVARQLAEGRLDPAITATPGTQIQRGKPTPRP